MKTNTKIALAGLAAFCAYLWLKPESAGASPSSAPSPSPSPTLPNPPPPTMTWPIARGIAIDSWAPPQFQYRPGEIYINFHYLANPTISGSYQGYLVWVSTDQKSAAVRFDDKMPLPTGVSPTDIFSVPYPGR